jgi:hypothetical protein
MAIASTWGMQPSTETYARCPVWYTAHVEFRPAKSKKKSNASSCVTGWEITAIKPKARDARGSNDQGTTCESDHGPQQKRAF